MTAPLLRARPGGAHAAAHRRRLPGTVAFYLLASIIVGFLAGSSAPTPLYAVYAARWHFSPITTTVVFGVYALAVLAALLIVGRLSDHVGRRPVLLAALAIQVATMVVFATAHGVPQLLVARIVQGLSTGAAAGAIGAGMLDLNKVRGTIANAVAPITGTASGALGSGLLVQYLPQPTHLVYLVLLGVFVLQAIGVLLMPETSSPTPGALASLRPQFAVPGPVRRPLMFAVPALVAVWALAGLYGALGPSLVKLVSGSASIVLGGLSLFVLAGSGVVAVLLFQRQSARQLTLIGGVALLAGVALTLVAVGTRSTAGFFVGTAIAGIGFGGGFQGAIRSVVPLAAPHQRAGVLSVVYVVSYLAMGLPAVIAGFLLVHEGNLVSTAVQYGVAVMVLAALALLGAVTRPAVAARPERDEMIEPEQARQMCTAERA
ncbi:MAG TPA: MFS transporter [Streptosporangiaceae bacterium]|nr:MFS transporter [Streptosporangiaceae bacterium]